MTRRLVAPLLAVACTASLAGGSAASSPDPAMDFDTFVEATAETLLARLPEEVTDLGLSSELGLRDDRLNDMSWQYRLETARLATDALDQLGSYEPSALTADQRITHEVAAWYLTDIVEMAGYLDHEYAVNYITGPHANFPEFMADIHPMSSVQDAEAYIERLRASAAQLRQIGHNLTAAEAAGTLPTDRGIGIAAWQIRNQLTAADRHPLVSDLETRLGELDVSDDERQRLVDEAALAVETEMLPAYRELLDLVTSTTTRPDTRPGVLAHPDGRDWYAAVLRHHTTTSLTQEEVHDTGLRAVDRVQRELTAALDAAGFDAETVGLPGALSAAVRSSPSIPLRSDDDRRELLSATEDAIAVAEGAFGTMFTTTPSSPIEVQRPRPGREGAAGAYYRPPPAVGDRPGIYYLGLAGDSFATDTYATTNFHEAVPGHHFQVALQRESTELPLLQRATTFTGYAEGWALYAERLAYEAGLYEDDPLGDIGRLRMELLRAGRAVADTGIHALGWSRAEAIDYLVGLGFPEGWAASEVDRYIVWPGQAPAYLIGMLEILRLRDQAELALGSDFDLAAFHDAILRHGSVPLEVLPDAVQTYIDASP